MQYIYFGLVPFMLAGWFVYRGWYKKRELYDGTTGANFVYLLIFTGIYAWYFGIFQALFSSLLTLIIWLAWGNAVRKLEAGRNKGRSD